MSYYGNTSDAAAYHAARGNSEWADLDEEAAEAALLRGSDYVDQRYRERLASGRWASRFPGERAGGRAQAREWPRVNAVDYEGNEIPDDEAPIEVVNATYEAALREAILPGSLSPDYTPSELATKEKVGPIEVQYATGQGEGSKDIPTRPVISVIDEILAPVLIQRYDMPAVAVV